MSKASQQASSRFINVGRIIKSIGLDGDVLVDFSIEPSFLDDQDGTVWVIPPTLFVSEIRFKSISPAGDRYRVTFDEVDSIDIAKELCQRSLLMRADEVPDHASSVLAGEPTELGYSVHSLVWGTIGEIVEIIETRANSVWVVDGPYGEVLLPVIESVVLTIDDELRKIEVHVLPGLIEGEPQCE